MRFFALAAVVFFGVFHMGGAVLTPGQALQRVSMPGMQTKSANEVPRLLTTKRTISGEASVYVFENPYAGNGYIVVSADDQTVPLLGYSESGDFTLDSIPPQLEWWLSEYGRQIAYARDAKVTGYSEREVDNREPVAPLLGGIKWDQMVPYNDMCPELNGERTPTGCVATAMAQIMKYWNYPESGKGTASVILPATGKVDVMSFTGRKFDWDNMLDSYSGQYSEEEAVAVAYLMKACGYSCEMSYNLGGSGSSSMKAAWGMVENFRYNANLRYCSRDYYTLGEWESLLYEELKNGRPVLYGGQSTSVGHEFVCDGYSSDGYFHFNWGWGGLSDGYFLLDALNPNSVGMGGGDGGGFNFGQDVVVGIQPDKNGTPQSFLTQMGNLSAKVSGNSMTLNLSDGGWWVNMGLTAVNVNFGVCIEPLSDISGTTRYLITKWQEIQSPKLEDTPDGTMVSYYGISGDNYTFSIPKDLADGKYKVTVCTQSRVGADNPWIPVLTEGDCFNYVYLIKESGQCRVDNMDKAELRIEESTFLSGLYFGSAAKLSLTVSNASSKELSRCFYPRLYRGGLLQMEGEGIVTTVYPGERQTREFTVMFDLVDGVSAPLSSRDYTLRYYDPSTKTEYDWSGIVRMEINNSPLSISVDDFTMPGLESREESIPVFGRQKVYYVSDKDAVPFSCSITNNAGFFGYPVVVYVFPAQFGVPWESYVGLSPIALLEAGESATLHGILDFDYGEVDKYYMGIVYVSKDGWIQQPAEVFFKIAMSGVREVEAYGEDLDIVYDSVCKEVMLSSSCGLNNIEVYSMSGGLQTVDFEMSVGGVSASVAHLPKGIYIVTATDKSGVTKSLKIVR